MKSFMLLAFVGLALALHSAEARLPKELGRFKISHAAFIEVFESSDVNADPLDRLTLYISTFNAALFGVGDPVWELKSPGRFMDVIERWDQLVQKMGDEATALWPNYPVQMPKEIAGFEGIVQTSGFIPPGKKSGQLEVYNIDNRQGPWNIAGLDDKTYSYHWLEWKDIDDDGLKDVLTARFHVTATGKTTSELIWLKNPGNLGLNGEGFENWEQTLLIEGGPDVVIQFETMEANGVTYEAFVTAELWNQRIVIYYVEAGPGAWMDPFFIKSVVLDDAQGVPFEAHLFDLNNDGKLEVIASAIDESVPEGAGGNLIVYLQPENGDFTSPTWQKKIISTGFKANAWQLGNKMTPGKMRSFYPSTDYAAQTTEFGGMKPWISLSGDDNGKHYVLTPVSEDRDNWEYERELLVETGKNIAGTMAVLDIDNDGYTEIIAAGYSAGEVYVFSYAP